MTQFIEREVPSPEHLDIDIVKIKRLHENVLKLKKLANEMAQVTGRMTENLLLYQASPGRESLMQEAEEEFAGSMMDLDILMEQVSETPTYFIEKVVDTITELHVALMEKAGWRFPE